MFGLFLAALDAIILHQLGTAAREYVRNQIRMAHDVDYDDDDGFNHQEIYDCDWFYTMLQAAVDYSDVSEETLLVSCGAEVFDLCQTSDSYSEITFWSFLHNVENISGYSNDVSLFLCEDTEDDDVLLHYYYQWKSFEVIAASFVKAVAKNIYCTSIEMKVLMHEERKLGKNIYYVCFSVNEMLNSSTVVPLVSDNLENTNRSSLLSITNDSEDYRVQNSMTEPCPMKTRWPITSEVFNELFPFNIVFDDKLVICATGNAFNRLCPAMVNCHLTDFFKLCAPSISLTYNNIVLHRTNIFNLRCHRRCSLEFKGEMIVNPVAAQGVYICSPVVDSLESMSNCNIFVSDLFYLVDCQEAIFLNMHLTTAKQVRQSLEAAKDSLSTSQRVIKEEKQRSLDLLHSILPSFAIDKYLKGKDFEPTKYDNVTVLFSDIEGFANICDFCEPLEAIKLLDLLFSEFDQLSEQYGVFKLESYSDVYILADTDYNNFGCPDAVLAMGFAMKKRAMNIALPNSMDPIKIRIGIHTGPVVVAVLNRNMPHFCMFGHTVNKASRMCTHGAHGKIHVSAETHDVLIKASPDSCQYQFECRGEIPIKGLGNLKTYFVESYQEFETMYCAKDIVKFT